MSGNDDKKDAPKCKKAICDIRNVTHPLRYYEFTQDEIKALEECDRESFYHRCIPFSTLFASLTFAAIKFGIMKKNPHFGIYPKLLFAVVVGHLYGRLSYMGDCEKKLKRLPAHSYLGNVMRKHEKDREEAEKA